MLIFKGESDRDGVVLWKNNHHGQFDQVEMPGLNRFGFSICKYNDRIVFATGGRKDTDCLNSVQRLDVVKKKWDTF